MSFETKIVLLSFIAAVIIGVSYLATSSSTFGSDSITIGGASLDFGHWLSIGAVDALRASRTLDPGRIPRIVVPTVNSRASGTLSEKM
jgi:hypothetical protein